MRRSHHRARRSGALFVVLAIVAGACASGGQGPTLADSRGAADTAAAMEILVEADAIEAVPTAGPPELLGVEEARQVPPPVLAFDLGGDEVPDVQDGGEGAAAATAEEPAAATPEPTPTPELEPPSDDVAAGPEDEASTEVDDPDATPVPAVPSAADGVDARYENPSDIIVSAGGRPFEMPAADTAAMQGVTEDTILIGGLITESLAGFFHREGVCEGAAARFEQANQHDELTRAVDFQGCYDDVGDVTIAEGLTYALVRDGVFAVVPLASDTWFADDVLTDAQVPYVGPDRLPGFCGRGTPFGFGTHGAIDCPVLDARGYVTLTQPVLTAWVESHEGSPPVGHDVHLVPAGPDGEVVGASRVFEADLIERERPVVLPVLPAASDGPTASWTEVVDAALAEDPVVVFIDGDRTDGLPQALRAAGYEGEIVLVGVIDPLDVADAAARVELAPLTVISPGLDIVNRSSAGWERLVGAAAAVDWAEDEIGLDFMEGYLAADFVVRAIAATPEPLSGHALAATLNAGWWYPGVEGLACGSWWPASHYIEAPCVSVSKVEPFASAPVLGLVDTAPQLRFNLGE